MTNVQKDFKHLGEYYDMAYEEKEFDKERKIKMMIIFVAVAALIIGAISVEYLGNDNKIEEVAEAVVDAETGVVINLDEKTTP